MGSGSLIFIKIKEPDPMILNGIASDIQGACSTETD